MGRPDLTTAGDEIEQGDYITGETGVYEVAEIDRSRSEPYNLTVASERPADADAQSANAGWSNSELVDDLGEHIPRDDLEAVSVADGDELVWTDGTVADGDASVEVTVDESGAVHLESDGLFVPRTLPDVLTLRCNIVSGFAEQIDE